DRKPSSSTSATPTSSAQPLISSTPKLLSSFSSKPKPSSSYTPKDSLSNKLGKDGKLTTQEHKRRLDNHLCLFCGGVGHAIKNCPKSSSSASKAKARAAQVKEKPK